MATNSEPPTSGETSPDDWEPLPGESRDAYRTRRWNEAFGNEHLGSWEQAQAWQKAHQEQISQIRADEIKHFGLPPEDPNLYVTPLPKMPFSATGFPDPEAPKKASGHGRFNGLKAENATRAKSQLLNKMKPLPGESRDAYRTRRWNEAFGNEHLGSWEQAQAWQKAHQEQISQIRADEIKHFGLPPEDPNLHVTPLPKMLFSATGLPDPEAPKPASGHGGKASMKKPVLAGSRPA